PSGDLARPALADEPVPIDPVQAARPTRELPRRLLRREERRTDPQRPPVVALLRVSFPWRHLLQVAGEQFGEGDRSLFRLLLELGKPGGELVGFRRGLLLRVHLQTQRAPAP